MVRVLRTERTPRATRLLRRERVVTWAVLVAVPFDPDLLGHTFFVAAAVTDALALAVAIA